MSENQALLAQGQQPYYSAAADEQPFDSRSADELESLHASEDGLALHAVPDATPATTAFNIIANIVGAGLLSLPAALHNASFGVGVILCVVFEVLSVFTAYALSVGGEYTNTFSQSQMLANCLLAQNDSAVLDDKAPAEVSSASMVPQTLNRGSADQELQAAIADADWSRTQINIAIDVLLGTTYLFFCVSFSKVSADALVSVSVALELNAVLRNRAFWLGILFVLFLAVSLRRVFKELLLTSVVAILTILFVVVCIYVRLAESIEGGNSEAARLPPVADGVDWWAISSSFFTSFATLSSAFGYHVNHPAYYQELRERTPAQCQKSVHVGLFVVALLYIVTGSGGYLLFGSEVASKKAGGNIVDNFSDHDQLICAARVCLVLHFVCVFPLMVTAAKQHFHRVALRVRGLRARADDPDEVFKYPFSVMALEIVMFVAIAVGTSGLISGMDLVFNLAGALGGNFALFVAPGLIGIYVFGELEERAAEGTAPPLLTNPKTNNYFGFCEVQLSFRTLRFVSWFVVVLGVVTTLLGIVVILKSEA